ncbi:MAG: NAD(P)/FAD-dependent oxidoreductase [Clostridium sp.]
MERYDIAIIGSGPAGISAALNARIRNKSFIVFGSKEISNKLALAPAINNYLGFSSIKGKDLLKNFQNHIKEMEIDIIEERVNNVYSMGDYFTLMVNQKMYEAKTVILATGIEYTKPLPGEEEFLGKGVGYCATCDAPLYRGKEVTIISYSKEGEEEANFVSELASNVNYIPMYRGEMKLDSKINLINERPKEIVGESKVSKVILKSGEGIDTDGVFLLKNAVPPTQLVPGLEIEDGHIKVDRLMKTNIKGCYAAGDCIGKPYQYIKSAGEGNIAALSAVTYLAENNI